VLFGAVSCENRSTLKGLGGNKVGALSSGLWQDLRSLQEIVNIYKNLQTREVASLRKGTVRRQKKSPVCSAFVNIWLHNQPFTILDGP
jgi:hypothetical protein